MPLALTDLPMLATPKQAAEVMGPTEAQVRGLIQRGELAHRMIGKRIMIPRHAIEAFINNITVSPCRDETMVRVSGSTAPAPVTTSSGLREVAAGSAARALQIASSLKSPSPTSSTRTAAAPGRVIPLRS
jgi:excisionase family DNA binding protein